MRGARGESRERAERAGRGAMARCWRRHRMGIKRTQAAICKEFQLSSNKSGGGVCVCMRER